MNNISPFYQKILAVLILCAAIWGGLSLIILPFYSTVSDQQERIALLEKRLFNYQKIVAEKDSVAKQLEEMRQNSIPDLLYCGDTVVTLNAQIQNDVRQLITNSGGRIETMQSVSMVEEEGIQKAAVRLVLETDMEILTNILRSFSRHGKFLNIENITLRTADVQNDGRTPIFKAQWDIYSYGTLIGGRAN